MSTEATIIALVRKFGKVATLDIDSSTRLKELNFDSLDFLELQMGVDEAFGVEIPVEDFLKCATVGDITALVLSRSRD